MRVSIVHLCKFICESAELCAIVCTYFESYFMCILEMCVSIRIKEWQVQRDCVFVIASDCETRVFSTLKIVVIVFHKHNKHTVIVWLWFGHKS